MPPRAQGNDQIRTIADLCWAIEERRVPVTAHDGVYEVRCQDVYRARSHAALIHLRQQLARRRPAS